MTAKVNRKSSYFPDPESSPQISPREGLRLALLTGLDKQKMMMALSTTQPGHSVPIHSHPHEQIGMVCSGRAILRIGADERSVKKGDFYCVPANVPHGTTCIGDESFMMIEIFYPIRREFVRAARLDAKGRAGSNAR